MLKSIEMRTCWGITRKIKFCRIPTGGKWLCLRHRTEPIYFLILAITGICFSYISGLLPKPPLPWEKKIYQESPPPEAPKVTATPTTERPPLSSPLTVNMHFNPQMGVIVRRHDLSEKSGRENIRKQLSEFIGQGEELQNKLVAPQLSDTDADAAAGKWDKAVRQFLDEHMGTDYVTQFGSVEGITYGAPLATPNSKPKQELWRSIYARNLRLKQFLQEVKD